MSLRRPAEAEPAAATDGRSYRRGFQYYQNERRKEQERRQREANERRVVAPPTPSTPPPPPNGGVPADGPFPLASPRSDQWSISAVGKLWDLLTLGNAAVVSLTVGRWTIALNRSQPAREALGLPAPNEIINEFQRRNRNYALRVFTDASVSDAGGSPTLTLAILTAYLTRSPNPLGLIPTNDTSAPVHAGRLPHMFLRV